MYTFTRIVVWLIVVVTATALAGGAILTGLYFWGETLPLWGKWLLLGLIAIALARLILHFSWYWFGKPRYPEGRCHRCGYDIQKTSIGQNCPECGTLFPH